MVSRDVPPCIKTLSYLNGLTVSSSVVENLVQHCKEESASAYVYFFFDGRSAESELSLHEKLVRSFIQQLWDQFDRMPSALEQVYGEGPSHPQPSITALQDILQDIISQFEHVYVVIDALDECADRKRLLSWIKTMPHWRREELHALFSSRREPDIEDNLNEITGLQRMNFVGGSANPDIVKYVTEKLSEVERWSSDIRVLVRSALLDGADGRYVKLLLVPFTQSNNIPLAFDGCPYS